MIGGAADNSLPMKEETYGPLAAIRRVYDEREALAVANALPFGLAADVYSRDLERAWAFVERIEAGTVESMSTTPPISKRPLAVGIVRLRARVGPHAYRETRLIRMRVRPFAT